MTTYFVAANGAQTGPFTIEEIQSQCSRGIIQRDTLMWREGLSDWLRAETVLQGADVVFASSSLPTAPPPLRNDSAQPGVASDDLGWYVPATKLAASRGSGWIGDAWRLFAVAPGMWCVATLIFFGVQIALNLIPIIGGVFAALAGPSFMAGLLVFSHGLAKGERAELGALFAGFKDKFGALVVLGLITFCLSTAVMSIVGSFAVVMLSKAALIQAATNPQQMVQTLMLNGDGLKLALVMLLMLLLMLPVMAAYWYAPGLIYFARQSPTNAMKHSLMAFVSNWLPILVYSLLGTLILLLSALPFGLGLIVTVPLMMATSYTSFRDMFGRTD